MNDIKLRRIAMQAMLPGLEMSVEHSLELLNSARNALSMAPLVLAEGEPSDSLPSPARRGRPPLALSAATNMVPVAPLNGTSNGKRRYQRRHSGGETDEEKAARRAAQNKAAQQRYIKNKRLRQAAEAAATAGVPAGAYPPGQYVKRMPEAGKKKLASHTAERWRVIREAGLDSHGKLPSNVLFDQGKRILERRAREAAKRETQE